MKSHPSRKARDLGRESDRSARRGSETVLPLPKYVRYLDAGPGKVADDVVARKLGVLKGAVKKWRKRLGIPISAEVAEDLLHRRPIESDSKLAERIRRLADQDLSFTRIVLLSRAASQRVRRVMREFGIEVPSRRRGPVDAARAFRRLRRGKWLKSYRARLLDRYGRRIRRLVAKGENAHSIAEMLVISRQTTSMLAKWMKIQIPSARMDRDWSSVDWTRPNREIAREMDCDTNEVSRRRRVLRAEGKSVPRSPFPRFTEEARRNMSEGLRRRIRRQHERLAKRIRPLARLGLTAEQVGRRLGVSGQAVRSAAKAVGMALARPHSREEWLSIDWNRSNLAIARAMAVQRKMVSQMRLKLRREGHPVPGSPDPQERCNELRPLAPPVAGHPPMLGRRVYRFDWTGVDWTLPNPEIARRVGAALGTVVRIRTEMRRRSGGTIPRAIRPGLTEEQRRNWAESMRRRLHLRYEKLDERIRPLAAAGRSAEEIGRDLRVSADRVRRAACALGIPLEAPRRQGFRPQA